MISSARCLPRAVIVDFPWRLTAPAIAAERGHPLPYSVEFRDDDRGRQTAAAAHGFGRSGRASHAFFERQLDTLPSLPAVPAGFVIRPLAGAAEAAAYAELHRAAFDSEAMTAEWRERIIGAPLREPDLDLVVVAPDRTLAGFCVGWYEPARGVAQIEPIGTHPRCRRRGLSNALLTEMLHRFKRCGATVAVVETDLDRTAARTAYVAAGFVRTHTIWRQEAWAIDVC